jgi:hypothetical protein
MAEGCHERMINPEFLRWVWNYRRRSRQKVLRLLEEQSGGKQVFILRSSDEVERFLA